jgi:glycosyltransferase involved in cell wall biosynthesis
LLGEYGFYFKSDDVEDLALKLQWALEHPAEMAVIAQRAQAHVRASFSWEQIVKQYDSVYHRVIDE